MVLNVKTPPKFTVRERSADHFVQQVYDITNLRFKRFSLCNRVEASLDMLPMAIFDSMQSAYQDFEQARASQRLQNPMHFPAIKKQKLAEKTKW